MKKVGELKSGGVSYEFHSEEKKEVLVEINRKDFTKVRDTAIQESRKPRWPFAKSNVVFAEVPTGLTVCDICNEEIITEIMSIIAGGSELEQLLNGAYAICGTCRKKIQKRHPEIEVVRVHIQTGDSK